MPFTATVTLDLVAGPSVTDGTPATITVFGQTFSGSFTSGVANITVPDSAIGSNTTGTLNASVTFNGLTTSMSVPIYDSDGSGSQPDGTGFQPGDFAHTVGTDSVGTYDNGVFTVVGGASSYGMADRWDMAVNIPGGQKIAMDITAPNYRIYLQYGPALFVNYYPDPDGGFLAGTGVTLHRVDLDSSSGGRIVMDPSAVLGASTPITGILIRGDVEVSNLNTNSTETTTPKWTAPVVGGGTLPDLGPLKGVPFAEGFAADTVGGRGTTIHQITNTGNSGTGSAAEVLNRPGSAYVVPVVSGYIQPSQRIQMFAGGKTLFGQSAPGDGIVFRNSDTFDSASVAVEANQIIFNHVVFGGGPGPNNSSNMRSITINDTDSNVRDVLTANCDFLFATDQNYSVWFDTRRISSFRDLIAEPLDNSTHEKGRHGFATIFGSVGAERISMVQTLIAKANQRNPLVTLNDLFMIENCMVWNSIRGSDFNPIWSDGTMRVSHRNNVYLNAGNRGFWADVLMTEGSKTLKVFDENNYRSDDYLTFHEPRYIDGDETEGTRVLVSADNDMWETNRPSEFPVTTDFSREVLRAHLVANAGALPARRYAHSARIMGDVAANTPGPLVNSVPGGYPTLSSGPARVDTSRADLMTAQFMSEAGITPTSSDYGLVTTDQYGRPFFEIFQHWLSLQPA